MSELNVTEGDWTVREWKGKDWPENRVSIGPVDDHKAVAVAISPRYAEREQMLRDAYCMSASKDLYKACEELIALGVWQEDAPALANMKKAMAKARGE